MGMELLIAILLGVFAASFALQLVGSEWFARLMVLSAMANLPDPLRHLVVEECHAELKEMPEPWTKLYIVLTCFLDACRLEHLWRTNQKWTGADVTASQVVQNTFHGHSSFQQLMGTSRG
jgi:hypothetical protein